MKKGLMILLLPISIVLVLYAGLAVHNNIGNKQLDVRHYQVSLEAAIQWLQTNEDDILAQSNPMLWWMVMRSHELTRDYRLGRLYRQYEQRYLAGQYQNFWRMLFDKRFQPFSLPQKRVALLPDYNQYFLYALSCDAKLAEQPIIQAQMDTNFCWQHHPISPACITHQMMGLAFRQQRSCGDVKQLAAEMSVLQDKIQTQLRWDPRVVDVYLQRVLMLLDTDGETKVNPRWLYRVMQAQLETGGWSGFQPLLPLGGGRAVGFYAKGVRIGRARADFHATAQGLLIMALQLQSKAT